MEKKEIDFKIYVDYVTKYSKINPPEALFKNIENDVNQQIFIARILSRDDDTNLKSVALKIFEDAAKDFENIKEEEIKIFFLKEMGALYWNVRKDKINSLKYLIRAYKLVKKSNIDFCIPVEQQIWYDIMTLLYFSGKEKKVLEECKRVIERNYKTLRVNEEEYTDEEIKKRYYIDYAYLLLAYISVDKGNIESARHYLHFIAYSHQNYINLPQDKEIILELIDRIYKHPY